jgi:hypothetical protein
MLGVFGAVLGAVGLSVLTFTYHAIFYPSLVGDENYFVHYLLTAPVGACLGAGAIYGITQVGAEPKKAARAYLLGSVAATFTLVALAYWQGVLTFSALLETILLYLPVSIAYVLCLLAGIINVVGINQWVKPKKATKQNESKDQIEQGNDSNTNNANNANNKTK